MDPLSCSYLPRDTLQPKGARPWCATCDTDLHLTVDSVVVLSARRNTLAAAVSCTRCGRSRVLATTADLMAGVQAGTPELAAS